MDVIILFKDTDEHGRIIQGSPILVQHEVTAEAEFDHLAEKILGDDYSELTAIDYSQRVNQFNDLAVGYKIEWFCNLQVNTWNNNEDEEICFQCGEPVKNLSEKTMCPHCLTSF